MIQGFSAENDRLRRVDIAGILPDRLVWVDLSSPSAEEEALIERLLDIDVPTREDMEEIEISSRLYYEDGAAFMTATVPAQTDSPTPEMAPVTFVLAGERLITVRYHEPRPFRTFPMRAEKTAMPCGNGEAVLIALLEAIVDRLADILERAGRDIDKLSRGIFKQSAGKPAKSRDFQDVLEQIGREGDLTSNIRDSLVTLDRLVGFLAQVTASRKGDKDLRVRVKTLARDIRSLTDHSGFLSQKITFLLDATLGMINIEQNAIIKIFSVVAVIFLPPTLVASIYGMNFEVMPELSWPFGYPFALLLMVGSAILPFLFFKRRGWL